jgi:hypothetical protein
VTRVNILAEKWEHARSLPGRPYQAETYTHGDTVDVSAELADFLVAHGVAAAAQPSTPIALLPPDNEGEKATPATTTNEDATGSEEPIPALPRPKRTAPKAEWVEYAVSFGMDPDDAEATNREDLIRDYYAAAERKGTSS